MERVLEDVTQQVPTKTVVINVGPQHLFNHESRLKKEAKGGYLEGKIRLFGLMDSDVVDKIKLYLVSDIHRSRHHCNFLHITGTGNKRDENDVKNERRNEDWEIILINDAGKMVLESECHQYLKNVLSDSIWDEYTKTIHLGRGRLQLNIVLPLSKTNLDFKKIIDLRSKSDRTIVDDITKLCRSGEPFMHLARLHAVVHLKDSPITIEGTSDLITDKNRYDVRYDNLQRKIILNNSILQTFVFVLDKCMCPEKITFSGRFVCVDEEDEKKMRMDIDDSEIKIIHIMRTGHEKKCVEVYFTTTCGKILGGAILGQYKLYFQLVVEETGNLGEAIYYKTLVSEKNTHEFEIGACINHVCELDRHLRCSETCSIDKMLSRATEHQQSSFNINQCGECWRAQYNLEKLCKISKELTLGSDLIVEEPATSDNSHSPPKQPKTVILEEKGKEEIKS